MTITTHSPIYQKAFEQYLRKGTSIEISLKRLEAKAQETPFYIWRTVGDDKVRASHAANEGTIFARANPPATGNPGAAIHCRCTAEPYVPEPGLDGVYPELLFLPGGVIVRRIGGEIIRRVLRRNEQPQKPVEPAPLPKPDGIPKNWEKIPADKKEGIKYIDPKNRGNDVRIQRGNPTSQYPKQRGDYVKWKKNGQYLDKRGKPVPGDSPEAHIPVDEFKFNQELFK